MRPLGRVAAALLARHARPGAPQAGCTGAAALCSVSSSGTSSSWDDAAPHWIHHQHQHQQRRSMRSSSGSGSSSWRSAGAPQWAQPQSHDHQHQQWRGMGSSGKREERLRWEAIKEQGHTVNPCNSKLHPAAAAGMAPPEGAPELSLQEAYTPNSKCFGCGPAAEGGPGLRSYRTKDGLEARVTLGDHFCAFPGIISGGILSTILDCHGNWTAAVALMDRAGLAQPPLTLTASILVSFKEPAPPNTPLIVRSSVVEIKEGAAPGVGKASVEVDVAILQAAPEGGGGAEKVLATATMIAKKRGGCRAL